MIITIEEFWKERSSCFACNRKIQCIYSGEYPAGSVYFYSCPEQGHYNMHLIQPPSEKSLTFYNEDIFFKGSYTHIDYELGKANIKENDHVPVVVNVMEKHMRGKLVSREGLAQLVHKASIVKHLR